MKLKELVHTETLDFYAADFSEKHEIPLFATSVSAGFPSPADDYSEIALDLNKHLIKHPAATFYARVKGDSMINAGIHNGDLLIVDRALDIYDNCIAVCIIDGEFTVKRLKKEDNKILLIPENVEYKTIEVSEFNDFEVWGIVSYVVHKP
jgi:DNA polymerase V